MFKSRFWGCAFSLFSCVLWEKPKSNNKQNKKKQHTSPSVEVGPAGPGISPSTSWDLLIPPKDHLLGWEGKGVIYFYRVPISYQSLVNNLLVTVLLFYSSASTLPNLPSLLLLCEFLVKCPYFGFNYFTFSPFYLPLGWIDF